MGRNRVVEPQDVRIDISDGDWIVIKRQLNNAESRRAAGGALVMRYDYDDDGKVIPNSGSYVIDLVRAQTAKLLVWLLEWSLVDGRGRLLKVNEASIGVLDAETVKEIEDAIDLHQTTMERERENPTLGMDYALPSPSAGSWDGASAT